MARGVRRTSSRWGSRLEPFTHVDLMIAEGRTLDVVTQADTITPFSAGLGGDYERYTAGTVMLETAERLAAEDKQPALQQFLLLVGGLRAMVSGERLSGQVLDSYLLRSMAVAGYAPSFDHCTRCGDPGPHRWLNPSAGGVLCADCRLPGSATPAPGTVAAARGRCWPATGRSWTAEPRHLREASGIVAAYWPGTSSAVCARWPTWSADRGPPTGGG